jgi:tetratricopeptide (TPR) repeat protein
MAVAMLIGQQAAAFDAGDKVVLLRPIEMKTITGSTVALTPGTTFTIQAVEGENLKVAAGRVGWVEPSAVIAAARADSHFSDLISKDPQDAGAQRARGKIRFEKGDHDRGIADFDASLKLEPNSEALTLRGFAWKRKGDAEKAMANFDEAIKLNPKEALAWRVRGATWAGKEDYKKAVAEYSESIRLDPENPDSLHHRAVMLAMCHVDEIRNGKQALADATKACEISEWKNPLYINGLVAAYAEVGDFDSAIKWHTQVKGSTDRLEQLRQHKPFRSSWKR